MAPDQRERRGEERDCILVVVVDVTIVIVVVVTIVVVTCSNATRRCATACEVVVVQQDNKHAQSSLCVFVCLRERTIQRRIQQTDERKVDGHFRRLCYEVASRQQRIRRVSFSLLLFLFVVVFD